jgi:hypothetical protein
MGIKKLINNCFGKHLSIFFILFFHVIQSLMIVFETWNWNFFFHFNCIYFYFQQPHILDPWPLFAFYVFPHAIDCIPTPLHIVWLALSPTMNQRHVMQSQPLGEVTPSIFKKAPKAKGYFLICYELMVRFKLF